MKTGIIDSGTCNLHSVVRAVDECGGRAVVVVKPGDLAQVSRVILPGVGNFRHGMQELRQRGFVDALNEHVVSQQVPLLGICLGMQFLGTTGWESGETPGLDLIPGKVTRLKPDVPSERVPHVGWNQVQLERPCPLFEGIPDGSDFYFVHSYHFTGSGSEHTVGRTDYCGGFVSAVARDHVFGVQFHPEKSQKLGFQVLRNFLAM